LQHVKHVLIVVAALSALAMQIPFDGRPAPRRPPFLAEMQPGEKEIRSLAAGWPDRVTEIGPRDGEWMVRVGGQWFAWAHGRLLPEFQRSRWEEFAPFSFYDYPRRLSPLPSLDAQAAERFRARLAAEERHPPRRNDQLMSALFEAPNRASTESRLVRTEVAGFTVTVHERLKAPLSRVSRELQFLRRSDPQVREFLRGLAELNGYNYRYVDGTRSRSLHSYGAAVDFIPRGNAVGHSYWRWAMLTVPDWWRIPYEQRWTPPPPVIRAFEREGFVWGGKWLRFDTMHFEYRPDLFELRRLPGPLTVVEDGEA